MLKIKIISVGKIKDKHILALTDEFAKKLSRYCKFETIEIKEAFSKPDFSDKENDAAIEKEAQEIRLKINDNSYKIALCVEGSTLSSEEFSQKIEHLKNDFSEIDFIIGSSNGIDQALKNECDYKMSLSKMTFLHYFARLILTEQIYRAFKISSNETYHK